MINMNILRMSMYEKENRKKRLKKRGVVCSLHTPILSGDDPVRMCVPRKQKNQRKVIQRKIRDKL